MSFYLGFADELMKMAEFVTGTGKEPTFKPNPEQVKPSGLATAEKKAPPAKATTQATKSALSGMAGSTINAKQVRQYLPEK